MSIIFIVFIIGLLSGILIKDYYKQEYLYINKDKLIKKEIKSTQKNIKVMSKEKKKMEKEIENLKSVTRTAWTKTGRRESTAEHSWRLAMLLMVLEEDFKDIDINKAIKMSLVHDLGELYDGDISATLQHDNDNKSEMEERAMNRMLKVLPESISKQIYDLWAEYNKCATKEAKLVKAMDKLETIVQHNQGTNPKDFDYEFNLTYGKKYFEDDDTLKYMRNIIDEDTKNKIKSAY